ncbi:MAG: DegT/DnrJ/EryC1/StrS family aminotransferase [Thermoflexales bacterium]|nr:DegT/DnrJ/EryC1/StrS family aminotransferase [Thermoflexales bacterium]
MEALKAPLMGGMFGLPATGCAPPFLTQPSLLLVNARSGISLLVELLSPAQVWLPSYLCADVLRAVRAARTRFYPVDGELGVLDLDWLADVQAGDIVILVDYFGHPCDAACAVGAKERGAWVLEDACQALLSTQVGQSADMVLFSPRKFLGVPDGGILTVKPGVRLPFPHLDRPPARWWLKAWTAVVRRSEFDLGSQDRCWFELFQQVEREQPLGHYAMSEVASSLLLHGFDYAAIARRRVDNFQLLAGRLGPIALFPSLSPGTVPLGFPIRVDNRDQFRQHLFEHAIYPAHHWPIQDVVPPQFEASHRLSAELMTLPCDQRYGSADMHRMAQLVLQALNA